MPFSDRSGIKIMSQTFVMPRLVLGLRPLSKCLGLKLNFNRSQTNFYSVLSYFNPTIRPPQQRTYLSCFSLLKII